MAAKYYFITRWQIRAPVEDVWDAIYDSLSWPQWWKGVKAARSLEEGDERGINGVREYTWQSVLPYQLRFSSKLLEREDYKRLHGVADGDLQGEGTWHFYEKDGVTYLQYDWKVSTNLKWMNRFSFLLKPLFRYNHDVVMKWGAKGLARKLNAELLSWK
ncbi:MAG TPA: SRPBCC family protein [Chitinophagaceae bacterium]